MTKRKCICWCGPKTLRTLQQIFDDVWIELQGQGIESSYGPTELEALRNEIARRVFDEFADQNFDSQNITQRVLGSFLTSITEMQIEHSHDK